MKKLLVLFFALCFGYALQAQTTTDAATTKVVKKQQVQNPAAYACPKCFHISKGSGQCPDCKTATVQMTRKYCAKMGGTQMKKDMKEKANS